jgi:zinc transporter
MNHSIDLSHRDPDLFGLLYGFRFRPGERGREIDSATALRVSNRRHRMNSSGCT